MPFKKANVTCPKCGRIIPVASAKWNSRLKAHSYISEKHRHGYKFYVVKLSATGKYLVTPAPHKPRKYYPAKPKLTEVTHVTTGTGLYPNRHKTKLSGKPSRGTNGRFTSSPTFSELVNDEVPRRRGLLSRFFGR